MIMGRAINFGDQETINRKHSKIVWIMVILVVGAIMYAVGDNSHDNAVPVPAQHTVTETVPQCIEEDGSTQEVCWWQDDANGRFLNINYGQFVWVPQTGDMINWKE
jgi:hypothetical protein